MKRRRHENHRTPESESQNKHDSSSRVYAITAIKAAHQKSRKQKKVLWPTVFWPVGSMVVLVILLSLHFKTSPSKENTEPVSEPSEPYMDTDVSTTRILEDWDRQNTNLLHVQQFMDTYLSNISSSTSKSYLSKGYLHSRLRSAPHRRTHFLPLVERTVGTNSWYKNSPIQAGETILVLPRQYLIWDLDAFRCSFIQQQLFGARHIETGNGLDGGAFLAAFLIYRQKMSTGNWREDPNNIPFSHDYRLQYTQEQDDLLNRYLKILPYYSSHIQLNKSSLDTHSHRSEHFHPVLWSESEALTFLGQDTLSYNLVQAYRHMIISEYHAFNFSSSLFYNDTQKPWSAFGENIHLMEYMQMRLHVITRSFGTGPPGLEESLTSSPNGYKNITEELDFWWRSTGVNLTKGCRAMSPILDMWDHHASPNVDWRYDPSKRAFIIKAIGRHGIEPGFDVWVSYGKYSDTHLFSKFGFVNGDGSGYTESSIAVMHRLLDPGMGQQFSFMSRDDFTKLNALAKDSLMQEADLLKYLEYDDGYTDCINPEKNIAAFRLKKLKFQVLSKIANIYDRWVIKWQPRNPSARPLRGSIVPISSDPPLFDAKRVKFDGSKVLSTCRLITLIHEDYDGNAINILEQALKNESSTDTIIVTRQNDLSEFRSLNCLVRLTTIALSRYPQTTMDYYNTLSSSALAYGSPEWISTHVALGEMLSLESLRNIASSGAQMIVEKLKLKENSDPAAFIRKLPCPNHFSRSLLN